MPALPPFEIEKRLKKLEVKPVASTALVKKVGDQYEYDKDFIYVAYASALANLSGGAISSQSDATDFQLTPYNTSGVLLAYRGYLLNKSIYQSGDPTDYIWESTSGEAGFTSSERYHTTSTGLQESLGNPTKPGTNITWTVINAGTAVPSTAVYVAERFTITTTDGAVTSEWKIKIVGKHIDDTVIKTGGITTDTIASNAITSAKITANAITSAKVSADAITVDKIDLDGTLSVTANSGAIRWGKDDGDDITNSGLFIGRNSSGDPRFVIGSQSSFIYFNGSLVSAVGVSSSNTVGTETNIYTNTSSASTFTISPVLGTINIQLSGGGGGGGGPEAVDGADAGQPGVASSVVIKKLDGTTRTGTGALNITAAGGARGGYSGTGQGVPYPGTAGGSFSHGSATEPPFTNAAGGTPTGSAGSANGAIPSAGGGGHTNNNQDNSSGRGGNVGAYNSTTYTIVDSTDYLLITVGAGGAGSTTTQSGSAGSGARGVVRIKGVLS